MFKIFKYLKTKEWLMICISLVFIVASVWLDLRLPEFMAVITKLIQTEGSAMSEIWLNGGYMLLCALGSLAMVIAVGFLAAKIGASFSQRLRSELYNKVDSFSMGDINKFSTASLITRSTNDISQIQLVVTMGLQMVVKAPILAVWAILKIAGKGFEWTLATGVAVASVVLTFSLIIILVTPKFKKMQTLTDNINRVTRENLTGLPVVRAYNAEAYQEAKFEKVNNELTNTALYTSRAMAILLPVIGLVINVMSLVIYWIGAILINNAGAAVRLDLFSNMVVFSSYALQILLAFMMMTILFILLPRAQVSAKRINEVLDTEPTIKDGTISEGAAGQQGEVEFRNVSFKYPGAAAYVLQNVSFSAHKGETIAIIGSTGSGKSTLMNLIPRFYDTTEGTVLIDGVDVKDYKLASLYNKIGHIPQKAIMFSGTVTSNVAFGENGTDDAREDDVKNAVRIAQGTDFVEKMDDTYNAPITRSGTNVSGGQKQRLSIARAVCKKPEIYIFDDSFSALDYKTDRMLRTTLKREAQGVTSLIVAQRIGTIMDADKIIVLDEGKVVGVGKHKELLKTCSVYREIAMSQLSEEELVV
ncbi:MAG: ABC transporter ATP-binding protein/permease [Nitrososphaerota archaeon]|jgi:ATP-binding cassette subfamily B protein|nr:ABC transporter ATP-binding protein/permease [Nitrososphaerota archaeon]